MQLFDVHSSTEIGMGNRKVFLYSSGTVSPYSLNSNGIILTDNAFWFHRIGGDPCLAVQLLDYLADVNIWAPNRAP